ncbi:MAG: hypothetical protein AB1898_23320 [Acidobacteriota bacterium]
MVSRMRKLPFGQTWHPSEEELLRCLEGEGRVRANAKVAAHLQGCWACRVKQQHISELITAFMEDRRVSLGRFQKSPFGTLGRIRAKIDQVDAELDREGLWVRLRGTCGLRAWLPGISARWVVFAGLALAVALALMRLSSVPPVSAKELLLRSSQAETDRIRRVAGPVVYQKLEVRRRPASGRGVESVMWEIWNDAQNRRFRQRVQDQIGTRFVATQSAATGSTVLPPDSKTSPLPPLLGELEQVFRASQMQWAAPLSPRSFGAWRESIQLGAEEVVQASVLDGEKILTLKTTAGQRVPVETRTIVEAELLVRASDWHPFQQRLTVQSRNEITNYELTEKAFQVVALNALPPSIFADVEMPAASVPSPSASDVSPPTAAELNRAEIEARYALHRLRACLGEPLEVLRSPRGHVRVRGTVGTLARKNELVAVLNSLPLVSVDVRADEEAMQSVSVDGHPVQAGDHPSTVSAEQALEVRSSRLPAQEHLKRYFSQHASFTPSRDGQPEDAPQSVSERIADFSNQAVTLADTSMAEMWALRRLADWVTSDGVVDARIPALWLLEEMIRDHIREARTQIERTQLLLRPLLSAGVGSGLPDQTGVESGWETPSARPLSGESWSWAIESLRLFEMTKRVNGLLHGLFANGELEVAVEQALHDLSRLTTQLEVDLKHLEAGTAREFLTESNLPSLSKK